MHSLPYKPLLVITPGPAGGGGGAFGSRKEINKSVQLRTIISALASACIYQACADEQRAESIQGRWQLVSKNAEKIGLIAEWEISKSEVIVWVMHGNGTAEEATRFNYSIDKSKSPHWITFDIDDSLDGHGKDRRHGIFRIVNGELHICFEVSDGGPRPANFKRRFTRYKRVSQERSKEHDESPKP